MSTSSLENLRNYVFVKTDDPGILARRRMIAEWALEACPEIREKLIEEAREEGRQLGRLQRASARLQRVLAVRQLALSPEDEAQVEACTDLDTLGRWLDQAVVAASTIDALR
jgi:hypothetical protein